jgi:hypothetical protein
VIEQMLQIGAPAGKEVVEAHHVVPLGEETIAEMGADEAGTAGNQYPHESDASD